MFFEGPEKKVELALVPGKRSLRSMGRDYWEGIASRADAKILSAVSNESLDAYLLSESSLFVADAWLTMITCGRTDLAAAILQLCRDLGTTDLQYLIYERKNAYFQEYQPANFFDDAKRLSEAVPGRCFRFGDVDDHHVFLFHLDKPYTPSSDDLTLEVLMHGMGARAQDLPALFPGFQVDDHRFEPMGYSLNAIHGAKYYTVHVTPQRFCSYVSFETNCVDDGAEVMSARLIELFKPQSLDVILFTPLESRRKIGCVYPVERSICQELSCGYRVRFDHYFKPVRGASPAFPIKP